MKRSSLRFWFGVLGLLLVVPLGYVLFLGKKPPPPPPPVVHAPPPPVDAGEKPRVLSLSEVNGRVSVRKGDGGWVDAKPGETLAESDGVRTEDGSYAVLVGGEYWEVKMEPGTEVAVGQLSASISRLLLESGMARARVKPGAKHTFEVRAAHTDTTASTETGTFTVSSDGAGTMAVGADEGEVRFTGQGKVVIVKAGEESVVKPNQAPTAPKKVPTSLLLKVELPGALRTKNKKLELKGLTEPGARVDILGHSVVADQRGKFRTPLVLLEGDNPIDVKAYGVGGQQAESKHAVEVDTVVKRTTIDNKHLWDSPEKK